MTDSDVKILRFAALYDLFVTGLLLVPPLVPLVFGLIAALDAALGFGTPFAALDRTSVFFVNLGAAGVSAWALIRLLAPNRQALLVDMAFRAVLIACQIWAVAEGATPILLGISLVLAAIAALEWRVWRAA